MRRFSRGIGSLSAELLNQWGESSDATMLEAGRWDMPEVPRSSLYGPIACEVISYTRMAETGNNKWKWKYRLREVRLEESTPTISVYADGFDTETDTAINLCEQSNSETLVSGITIASLPGNYELKPIVTGAYVLAWVSPVTDEQDSMAVFDRPGEFDGDCT